MDDTPGDSRPSRSHMIPRPVGKGKGRAHDEEPGMLFGQFALAPATQTTTVTTTTVTTTRFPPFLMHPPRSARGHDTKAYPLATAATPSSLKNISFMIDGNPATFREAEDTSLAVEQAQKEFDSLKDAHNRFGKARRLERHTEQGENVGPFTSATPVSPESTDEEEREGEDITVETLTGKALRTLKDTFETPQPQGLGLYPSQSSPPKHPLLSRLSSHTPFTPPSLLRRTSSPRLDVSEALQHDTVGENTASSPDTRNALESSLDRPRRMDWRAPNHPSVASRMAVYDPTIDQESATALSRPVVPTPPIEGDAHSFSRPASRRYHPSVPSRLSFSDVIPAQDGSLPSPSLSPITAAAHGLSSEYFNEVDSRSERGSIHEPDAVNSIMSFGQTPDSSRQVTPGFEPRQSHGRSAFQSDSIGDFASLFDYFEAIPDELKSYVMHQLLRRCPKPTLHVVADAVNPALKCDFLTTLPAELGLNILMYLDVRSLCKASQVSRKWRQMINSDEGAWKNLFEREGFTLPDGELQRAIREGWGWQDPHGTSDSEQDFSLTQPQSVSYERAASGASPHAAMSFPESSSSLRRSKRKAASSLSSRSKLAKRKGFFHAYSADPTSEDFMARMSTAESPYNAANAAVIAIPNPKLTMPSLKGMHLYKSLFRRHYLVRRNWMREDTKPHHLAFRAHDRHVVTCLQFDTDNILTGSDDNNINVYDTKTGALKSKLVGHEGGVWALQYDGNTLVSGSTDRSVRVWDIHKGIETQVFRGHTSTVRCLQIVSPVKVGESEDGKAIMMPKHPLIITGSRDSTLRVWRLPEPGDAPFVQSENANEDEECPYFIRTLNGHTHSVRAIAAYADTLVSGSYDSSVRVWRVSTGETVHRLQGHTAKVYSVVLDHQRNRCISGSMDNMVKIWSLDTGSLIHTLDGHTSLVGLLDLNCGKLVSAAADSTLRIWDPENGQCKATLSAHTGAITCFQHDAQKVISGSDRTLKMWNIKTGECIKDLLSDLSGVWQVKFNERRCVAAVQRDNMTYIEVSSQVHSLDELHEANSV